ncbi:MAG: hypothetical protein AABY04_01565, partial [Candidatus Micrarchaeota archaeon]
PIMIVNSILALIALLAGPMVGTIFLVVYGALGLYSLYLFTIMLREVHEFSTMKAVLVWLIPVLLIVILMVAVLGVAFGSLLAMSSTGAKGIY